MSRPLYKQIKEQFQLGPASHITHIHNLDGIIANGLRSHSYMKSQREPYIDLSDPGIQLDREQKIISVTGKGLHDYVPLYFGWKSPMLMSHQDKNEEIIYLRFSLNILATPGAVISDGNARSNATKFFIFTDIQDLINLNPKAINDVKWAGDIEKKRQKQAEILIPDKINFSQVYEIICFSNKAKHQVMDILAKSGITLPVEANPGWYYVPKK